MRGPLRIALPVVLLGAGLAAGAARAEEPGERWRLSGRIGVETRVFSRGAGYPEQSDGPEASWVFDPELTWGSRSGRYRASFEPFVRFDGRDGRRSHSDVRRALWRAKGSRWELTTGVDVVFWGVTESRHLVDVINQTDLVEDVDGEDKLGQPMVEVATDRSWGRLEAYALLGFRERTFPGPGGRLRTPLPVDTGSAVFDSGARRRSIDGAVRWSHYFGDWDVGVHLFHGIDREPVLVPDRLGERLIPHYAEIGQAGADVQYTHGAWLVKAEALVREGRGDAFGAAVGGFEYTLYQVRSSPIDVGILAEYLYDGRGESAPATIYDDDVFFGSRLAFNDPSDSQILAGVVVDRSDRSVLASLEGERRVGRSFKLEVELRWFTNVAPANPLRALESDSHVVVRFSRYF